jgi:hypothetical protein
MCTYLLGPFLSLLPANWRRNLPWAESIRSRSVASAGSVYNLGASGPTEIKLTRLEWEKE